MINTKEIQADHKFSELSHYTYLRRRGDGLVFEHHQSGSEVTLSKDYVANHLQSAEQYSQEIKVGKEDKFWTAKQIADTKFRRGETRPEVGDLRQKGIRTIWEEIHSKQVFTVCYGVQAKKLTKKDKQIMIDNKVAEILDNQGRLKTSANSRQIKSYLNDVITEALNNPIVQEDRERILRGFKIEFTSRDGKYDCVDMDLEKGNNVRPVNINTLKWLVVGDVKYVLV